MLTEGFHILSGNSVANVPDAITIELRVFDRADDSLVDTIPLSLAGGVFSISVDTAVTTNWPNEIKAQIYVNDNGIQATKEITQENFDYFVRRNALNPQIVSAVFTGGLVGTVDADIPTVTSATFTGGLTGTISG